VPKVFLFLVPLFLMAACQPAPPAADRVFIDGAVYTVDAERSWAEAVAITDGRVVFVGSSAEAAHWIGENTEVTDLDGQMMLPGFHDSYAHVLIGVYTGENCDLLRVPTIEQVESVLRQCTELDGFGDERWILGGGWGAARLGDDAGEECPARDVDAVSPGKCVCWHSHAARARHHGDNRARRG
jgi:predicted amidohydrolase YtcJ